MSKVLLQLADQDFVVSPETAAKVEKSLPANRYVTITPFKEQPVMQLGQNRSKSVFDRHQPKLTDKEKEQAARFAKHLSKVPRTARH
jgi:hypothetical protein